MVLGVKNKSDSDDVGVIIVSERAGVGIPVSIRKHSFCIWIRRTMTKRGGGVGHGKGGCEDDDKE